VLGWALSIERQHVLPLNGQTTHSLERSCHFDWVLGSYLRPFSSFHPWPASILDSLVSVARVLLALHSLWVPVSHKSQFDCFYVSITGQGDAFKQHFPSIIQSFVIVSPTFPNKVVNGRKARWFSLDLYQFLLPLLLLSQEFN